MKRRGLLLCNTSYQVLVALWIKHKYFNNEPTDIIISDHFKDSENLCVGLKKVQLFENVYFAKTKEIARSADFARSQRGKNLAFPMKAIREFVNISGRYTDLFVANFDNFSQVLFNALAHSNLRLRLHVFEEGLSTYSSFQKYFENNRDYYGTPSNIVARLVHSFVYRSKTINKCVEDFYMFNPQLIQWNPLCEIKTIPKISSEDQTFKALANQVFGFAPAMLSEYDTKYIYFEESFLAEGTEINDVELVSKIAKRVGKENITVKIHPRNPINRFEKLGFRTNKVTYIPWEVILLNMKDLDEKVFITVASACILNPFLTFDKEVTAYSLYNCINRIPPILQNGLWEYVQKIYMQYPDKIHVCDSIEEIE